MSQVVVTLKHSRNQHLDLALPMDVRAAMLAPAIGQALNLSLTQGQTFKLTIIDGKVRRIIEPSETLLDAHVMFGDILEIEVTAQEAPGPPPTQVQIGWLQFENGEVYRLNPTSTQIGRWAPGNKVDLDLTSYDRSKRVSRCHARIENRHGYFFILDDESRNGTQVNGANLQKGEPRMLSSGDQILLGGDGGVQVRFVTGKTGELHIWKR